MTKPFLISCQLALHPYADQYLQIIRNVLESFDTTGLQVETGTMSTVLIGPEDLVWEKMRQLYELARAQGWPFRLEFIISTGCL